MMSTTFSLREYQSVIFGVSSKTPASHYHDFLLHIDRQAKHIERHLQRLIDIQSEGLLLSQQPEGNRSVSDGNLPLVSESMSPKGGLTIPVRQPTVKKTGIRMARKAIYESMYDLFKLRKEERGILASKLEEMDYGLSEVEAFNTKRAELEEAISVINNDRESQRSRALRKESDRLEEEIHAMETKLSQWKAKHKHVLQELSLIENSVESKLSSYKASLSLLDSDVREFLSNPPVEAPVNAPVLNTNQGNFYSLKSSRRTLEMAQEHWKLERSELQQRQQEVIAEIDALEEGGRVWGQVVENISGFEKRLKEAMNQSIQIRSQLLQAGEPARSKGDIDFVRPTMQDLAQTTELVEKQLNYAERKDWNLLICCISAELHALREAWGLLLSAFNVTEEDIWPSSERASDDPAKVSDIDSQTDPLGVGDADPPADLLRDLEIQPHEAPSRSEDEDDEPDPAWLLPEA